MPRAHARCGTGQGWCSMADEATSSETSPEAATATAVATEPAPPDPAVQAPVAEAPPADASAIEELLKSASFDDPAAAADPAQDAADFKLPDLQQVMQDAPVSSIDL